MTSTNCRTSSSRHSAPSERSAGHARGPVVDRDDERFGPAAERLMLRPGSRVLFSAVVMWEVTVKRALGRLSVPSDWSQPLLDGGACLCRHPALPGHGARGGHDAGGRAGVGAGRRDGGRAAPRPRARRVARRRLSRPHAQGARHAASPDGLLDTCHEERHPVGARALEHTIVQAALQRRDERMAPLVDLVSAFGEMDEPRKKVVGTISALASTTTSATPTSAGGTTGSNWSRRGTTARGTPGRVRGVGGRGHRRRAHGCAGDVIRRAGRGRCFNVKV